jgi:hypothetical protein
MDRIRQYMLKPNDCMPKAIATTPMMRAAPNQLRNEASSVP